MKRLGDLLGLNWRCGGPLVVYHTSWAEVPGSNPAWHLPCILHNDPDALQDHCVITLEK